jgi:hypothetical protein
MEVKVNAIITTVPVPSIGSELRMAVETPLLHPGNASEERGNVSSEMMRRLEKTVADAAKDKP